MVINTNLAAQTSSNNLNASQARLSQSLARISSGSRIVEPADDAAGLAMSTKIDAKINRIQGARSNVANATSFVQTQDGYLSKIGKALDRMSELAILAQDGTKSDGDRALYNKEFSELQDYIGTVQDKEFNDVPLFSSDSLAVTIDAEGGSFAMAGIDLAVAPYADATATKATTSTRLSQLGIAAGTLELGAGGPTVDISEDDTLQQVFDHIHAADPNLTASLDEATGLITLENAGGAAVAITATDTDLLSKTNLAAGTTLTVAAGASAASSSDITPSGIGIGTIADAKDSLDKVKDAISRLATDRATIGSYQARLSYSAEQLTISRENLTAASSRIKDVDVAEESTEYARANIMVQSGTAMLAQANQLPQQVLRLLQ
jgi:flagellin